MLIIIGTDCVCDHLIKIKNRKAGDLVHEGSCYETKGRSLWQVSMTAQIQTVKNLSKELSYCVYNYTVDISVSSTDKCGIYRILNRGYLTLNIRQLPIFLPILNMDLPFSLVFLSERITCLLRTMGIHHFKAGSGRGRATKRGAVFAGGVVECMFFLTHQKIHQNVRHLVTNVMLDDL